MRPATGCRWKRAGRADHHELHFLERNDRLRQLLLGNGRNVASARQRDVASGRPDPTATWDGSLQKRFRPHFKEVLTLGSGDVSQPIKDISGWHLVKVLEIRPKRQLALDEVREKAREKALDQKQRAARAYWIRKLREAAKIEIHDAAIRDFVKANEFRAGEAPPQHKLQ